MNTPDNNNDNKNTFIPSQELLALFDWIMACDKKQLRKIISRAITSKRYHDNLKKRSHNDKISEQEQQEQYLAFLRFFETLLFRVADEHINKKTYQLNLMLAANKIDASLCDEATIRFSVEKASYHAGKNTEINAKEQMFEELLKNWKPSKKTLLN